MLLFSVPFIRWFSKYNSQFWLPYNSLSYPKQLSDSLTLNSDLPGHHHCLAIKLLTLQAHMLWYYLGGSILKGGCPGRHAAKSSQRNSETQVVNQAAPLTFCIIVGRSLPLPGPFFPVLLYSEDIRQALRGSQIVGCWLLGSQGLAVGCWILMRA